MKNNAIFCIFLKIFADILLTEVHLCGRFRGFQLWRALPRMAMRKRVGLWHIYDFVVKDGFLYSILDFGVHKAAELLWKGRKLVRTRTL